MLYIHMLAKKRTRITLTFENYKRCLFYKILILIKTKNINVCCFQVITNQTN